MSDPRFATDEEQTYYQKALDLVADLMETLKPEEFEGRRWKMIAILRHAAREKR